MKKIFIIIISLSFLAVYTYGSIRTDELNSLTEKYLSKMVGSTDKSLQLTGKYKEVKDIIDTEGTTYWVDHINSPDSIKGKNPKRTDSYQVYIKKDDMVMSTGTGPLADSLSHDWEPYQENVIIDVPKYSSSTP